MYVEQQTGPTWLRGFGVVAAVIFTATTLVLAQGLAIAWGTSSAALLLVALLVLVVVGIAAIAGLFSRIVVKVDGERVKGYLVPLRTFSLPVGDIANVRITTVSPADAGGIGYRIRPLSRYLLFDAGPAVEIEVDAGRTYFVRSANAERLVAAVESARVSQRHRAPSAAADVSGGGALDEGRRDDR